MVFLYVIDLIDKFAPFPVPWYRRSIEMHPRKATP
jgi:hypothetical protein